MNISGWAFKENEEKLRDERYARYKELNREGIEIETVNTGYAQKTYKGKIIDKELSGLDILLICDSGNTCFGGVVSIENGNFTAIVYTD
ncbi:hypothetical protein NNC19_07360 [Clostridium sp. SHJSY1]|uniref:hypothetical protein n=1 Tax=Clostridium sp. SHJSY1 TaxID=2942483 RepID=UPI0028758F62|nr:hypothetical protein [Clostridium sp. SHJSY1]MDS0525492.1 hypothetical protein [Clostridium sp. SHJSY1]